MLTITVAEVQKKADKPYTKGYTELESLVQSVPELFSKNAFAPIFKSIDKHLSEGQDSAVQQQGQYPGPAHMYGHDQQLDGPRRPRPQPKPQQNSIEMRYDDYTETLAKNAVRAPQQPDGGPKAALDSHFIDDGVREGGQAAPGAKKSVQPHIAQTDTFLVNRDPAVAMVHVGDPYNVRDQYGNPMGGGYEDAEDMPDETGEYHMMNQAVHGNYGHPYGPPYGYVGHGQNPKAMAHYAQQHGGYYYPPPYPQQAYGNHIAPPKTRQPKKNQPEKEASEGEEEHVADQVNYMKNEPVEEMDPGYAYNEHPHARYANAYPPQQGYYYGGEDEEMMHMGGGQYHPAHYGKHYYDPRYHHPQHQQQMHYDQYMYQQQHYYNQHAGGHYDPAHQMYMEDSAAPDTSHRNKNNNKKPTREPLSGRDPAAKSGIGQPGQPKGPTQPLGMPQQPREPKKPLDGSKKRPDQQYGMQPQQPYVKPTSANIPPDGGKRVQQPVSYGNIGGQQQHQQQYKQPGKGEPLDSLGQPYLAQQAGQNQQQRSKPYVQNAGQHRVPLLQQSQPPTGSQELPPNMTSSQQQRKKGSQTHSETGGISPEGKPRQKEQVPMSPRQGPPQPMNPAYQRPSTATQNLNMQQRHPQQPNPMMVNMMGGMPQMMNNPDMMASANPTVQRQRDPNRDPNKPKKAASGPSQDQAEEDEEMMDGYYEERGEGGSSNHKNQSNRARNVFFVKK